MAGDTAWVHLLGGQIRYYEGKYRTRALEAATASR